MKRKVVVLLLTMGGPWSQRDVFPFLFHLFSDRAILPLPWGLRHALALLIAGLRRKKAAQNYALLGGGSPLLENTKAQAKALQDKLSLRATDTHFTVYPVMRYAKPDIKEVGKNLKKDPPDFCVLFPMYPQYSTTTTQSSLAHYAKFFAKHPLLARTGSIFSFYEDPLFIDALSQKTKPYLEEAQKHGAPILVMTAHGLPEAVVKKGDPYQDQCVRTADLVRQKLGLSVKDAPLCYQSRLGPVTWIGPFLEDVLCQAAQEKRPLVLLPLSFVADHVETLVELKKEAVATALRHGSPFCAVVPAVGTDDLFIENCASKVLNLVK